jgi:glycosyltransferase involved in cell wall biosynthesis
MLAWELKQLRDKRVLIATISPPDGRVTYQWAKAYKEMLEPPGSDALVVQGLPYGVARNYAVKAFMDNDYGYLFFLDSDIILPKDVLFRLIDTGFPLIGCYYTKRIAPFEPCFYNVKKSEEKEGLYDKVAITGWNYGDIVPCVMLPAGATLIHRSVFEKMFAAGITKPFEWTLDIDNPGGGSEDFNFSIRAVGLGIQPFVHTGIQARHETLAVCGVRGIEAVLS